MRRSLIIFLLLVLISACKKEEEKFVHEILFFRDNTIKMKPDTLPVSFKKAIENGKYTLNDEHGHVISEGKFSDGFKTGEWAYHPTEASTLVVNWSKYVNDSSKVEINYPEDWKTLEDPTRLFQAVFPLKENESEKSKYFIILSHNKDSIDLDLNGYQQYYKSQAFTTEKVEEYVHYVFETSSGKTFYLMKYIIQRENEEYLIFTFIGDKGSDIYDVTYSSLNEDQERKHIIFFDMIRSFMWNGERLFSPYDPVKDFRRLEYRDKPQTTT